MDSHGFVDYLSSQIDVSELEYFAYSTDTTTGKVKFAVWSFSRK